MLNCLLPLVGLRGLPPLTPAPTLYVNDLPGLTSELVNNLTTADQPTAADFFKSMQTRAALKLLGQVERQLADTRDWVRFLGETEAPQVYQPRTLTATQPGYYGVMLKVADPKTLDVFLNGLAVVATSAALAVPLVAFDLGDGQPLTVETRDGQPAAVPATVDLVQGFNSISFGELRLKPRFKDALVFVGLDLTNALTPSLLALEPPADVENLDFEAVYFRPGAATDLYGATYESWNTHGVHPLLSVECSAEKIVCRYALQFREAWLNFLGAEILREKVHSPRTNYFTLSNLQLTQDNLTDLSRTATAALTAVVKRLPTSVACQVCNHDSPGVEYEQNGGMP